MVCDINGLSRINERLGHSAGDQALQKLAALMRQCFPTDAAYLRCGEANLALICRGLDEHEAHLLLEDLCSKLA